MKRVVNALPTGVWADLSDIDPASYEVNPSVYSHFVKQFFIDLDQYIDAHATGSKGRLVRQDEVPPSDLFGPDSPKEVLNVERFYHNSEVRAAYVLDFDRQRTRVFLLEGGFYTYKITSLVDGDPLEVFRLEPEDMLDYLNEYAYFVNRKFLRLCRDRLMGKP